MRRCGTIAITNGALLAAIGMLGSGLVVVGTWIWSGSAKIEKIDSQSTSLEKTLDKIDQNQSKIWEQMGKDHDKLAGHDTTLAVLLDRSKNTTDLETAVKRLNEQLNSVPTAGNAPAAPAPPKPY
jgi:predicted negative regulator of RcsB-dependent stress response